METKKAKQWNNWRDVQQTFEVKTPNRVKMRLLWYWIKEIAKATGADPNLIQSHERTWAQAEKKERATQQLMEKINLKQGSEFPS